jgi:uncharacterized protein YegL
MSDIPGGSMATRPVHFFWLIDRSGSMNLRGKIGSLNYAIRDNIAPMRDVASQNPAASLFVRVLTFATGAEWHQAKPTPIETFEWSDVTADGVTDLGAALHLVASELTMPPMPERALPPVLALVSDGQPTDDWEAGLRAVEATPWGAKAVRVAIAIGDDADSAVLANFTRSSENVFLAQTPGALARAIRWASTTAVRSASESRPLDSGSTSSGSGSSQVNMADDNEDPW